MYPRQRNVKETSGFSVLLFDKAEPSNSCVLHTTRNTGSNNCFSPLLGDSYPLCLVAIPCPSNVLIYSLDSVRDNRTDDTSFHKPCISRLVILGLVTTKVIRYDEFHESLRLCAKNTLVCTPGRIMCCLFRDPGKREGDFRMI